MNKDDKLTTIRISKDTHKRLKHIGTFEDTLDSIIVKCIEAYNKVNGL
jgi:predicted DNA-binding protein